MGFTIDMVSGYVSDITNGADMAVVGADLATDTKRDTLDSFLPQELPQERLLPVAETFVHERLPNACSIPDSLIDCDIDMFIEEVSR